MTWLYPNSPLSQIIFLSMLSEALTLQIRRLLLSSYMLSYTYQSINASTQTLWQRCRHCLTSSFLFKLLSLHSYQRFGYRHRLKLHHIQHTFTQTVWDHSLMLLVYFIFLIEIRFTVAAAYYVVIEKRWMKIGYLWWMRNTPTHWHNYAPSIHHSQPSSSLIWVAAYIPCGSKYK